MDAMIAITRDFVVEAARSARTPLSEVLEFHLCTTITHFMSHPIDMGRLTVRLVQAVDMQALDIEVRRIGDECLIACGMFSERLKRCGGSIRHYAGVGQMAYERVGLTEVALGFPHMLDVMEKMSSMEEMDLQRRFDLARAGSVRAREELAQQGVIVFRPKS